MTKQEQLEQAKNYVFNKGKHKGETLYAVFQKDYKYIERLLHGLSTDHEIKKNIMMIMYGGLYIK